MKWFCSIASILAFSVYGATSYYVDATNGSDSNNGTSIATPWQTLAHATNAILSAGDSILLKRGEIWHEPFSFQRDSITLADYGAGALPIVDGQTTARRVINVSTKSGTLTQNIRIVNGGGGTGSLWLADTGTNTIDGCMLSNHISDACISGNASAVIIVTGCTIDSAFDDGITLHTTSAAYVTNCTVKNCSQGVNNSGTAMKMVISSCTFSNNSSADIGPVSLCDTLVDRCHFDGRVNASWKVVDAGESNTVFKYCLFDISRSGSAAAAEFNGSPNTVYLNCTFYGGSNYGKLLGFVGDSINLTNCIFDGFWKVAEGSNGPVNMDHCVNYNLTFKTPTVNVSEITSDPLFVNAGTANFHLQAGSPAIRAGLNIGLTPDLDGHAVANPPSIGAYEFITGPTISFSGNTVFSGRISQ